MKEKLNTFLSSMCDKNYLDEVNISTGIQDSYDIKQGKNTLSIHIAGNSALIKSSRHDDRLFHLDSTNIEAILCRLITQALAPTKTATFKGKTYKNVVFYPVESKNDRVVYKDTLGRRWVDSSFTEKNSLDLYDFFEKNKGEHVALMLPNFFLEEEATESVNLDSSFKGFKNDLVDYQEFFFAKTPDQVPQVGVLFSNMNLTSETKKNLVELNYSLDNFFDTREKLDSKTEFTKNKLFEESIFCNLELTKEQKINSTVTREFSDGAHVGVFEHEVELGVILSMISSWGYGYSDLVTGVVIRNNLPGYSDLTSVLSTSIVKQQKVEPKEIISELTTLKGSSVDRLLSSWGFDNPAGIFSKIDTLRILV